jgi:hypothetical protein
VELGDILFKAAKVTRFFRQPDVVFISNWRDEKEMRRGRVSSPPELGWAQPVDWLGIDGQIMVLGVTSQEIVAEEGKAKMLHLFREAVRREATHGRVFLAAASTKGALADTEILNMVHESGAIITDGDTMTWMLAEKAMRDLASERAWSPQNTTVAVIGAKGRLGRSAVSMFQGDGFHVLEVLRGDDLDLRSVSCKNLGIVVCTHAFGGKVMGSGDARDVIVFDAAEPKGGRHVFEELQRALATNHRTSVSLQWIGVGYAYHPRLFIPLRHILRLPRRVIFGCFAEALSWSRWMRNGQSLDRRIVETGSGHEHIIGQMLETDSWQSHSYVIASDGIRS